MDWITNLLGRQGYLPHGYCFTWDPGLLWAMVSADALIAASYFSIPITLVAFVRRRPHAQFNGIAWLFSMFIAACGLTHVMGVWTIWQPAYELETAIKWLTALVSLATAVAAWRLMPAALKIPSARQLEDAIAALKVEVVQRRQAQDRLAGAQQALLLSLSSVEAGYLAVDDAGRVTDLNATAEALFGLSAAQAMGQPLEAVAPLVPPATWSSLIAAVRADAPAPPTGSHRLQVRTPGGVRDIDLKAAPIRPVVPGDEGPGGFVMVFRDLSGLREAQAQAGRLAAIVASSQDAIIGKTLEGVITSWNHGAEVLFGYTADEALGRNVAMLMPESRVEEERGIIDRLARGLKVPPFETVRLHRDGRLVDVAVTSSPILDAQGHVVGASTISRDLSQQRQAEAMRAKGVWLEAQMQQMEEANRLKSEFLANMSHELRTPLNAIIGFADLLHSGAVPHDSPKHHTFLGHIASSGRHLLTLINDVLDLSKVEAGKMSFHSEPCSLSEQMQDLMRVMQPMADRQAVTLQWQVAPEVDAVSLDVSRLKQVVYNYVSNAIKFTPAGGEVRVLALPEGPDHVRIEVHDTGVGIAEADLPRLFTAFQQLDSTLVKRHQGTGLGLALTRRIVRAQGGDVGVRSVQGQGSVFHLVLPRVVPDFEGVLADGPVEEGVRPQGTPVAPLRLLTVQPRPEVAEAWRDGLQPHGFAVDLVADHHAAVQAASRTDYDAIALELHLPGGQPFESLQGIRGHAPNARTPVVALTLSAPAQSAAGYRVDDVLAKPLQAEQIAAGLKRAGLLRGGRPRPAQVLVVDDDPLALDLMAATLAGLGVNTLRAHSGQAGLALLGDAPGEAVDAIVLDLMMPGLDGFQFIEALNARWGRHEVPVFIWTAMILSPAEVAQLSQSAAALLDKGQGPLDALLDSLRRWRVGHGDTRSLT